MRIVHVKPFVIKKRQANPVALAAKASAIAKYRKAFKASKPLTIETIRNMRDL